MHPCARVPLPCGPPGGLSHTHSPVGRSGTATPAAAALTVRSVRKAGKRSAAPGLSGGPPSTAPHAPCHKGARGVGGGIPRSVRETHDRAMAMAVWDKLHDVSARRPPPPPQALACGAGAEGDVSATASVGTAAHCEGSSLRRLSVSHAQHIPGRFLMKKKKSWSVRWSVSSGYPPTAVGYPPTAVRYPPRFFTKRRVLSTK